MYNNRPHPLLEQVPLTVSPFVTLPSAPTLSYNYKTMPSNIPASGLGIPTADGDETVLAQSTLPPAPMPRFVVSGSGHAASPDEISASCYALLTYVSEMQQEAERDLRDLEDRIRGRQLAEKKKLAPGWLDSEARLLQPERVAPASATEQQQQQQQQQHPHSASEPETLATDADQGAELDRAFGSMGLQ